MSAIEASTSSTIPGTGIPAAVEAGSQLPVSTVCAQASSRALARAVRSRANTAASTPDNTRHATRIGTVTSSVGMMIGALFLPHVVTREPVDREVVRRAADAALAAAGAGVYSRR